MLNKSWCLKKRLSSRVSTQFIDEVYATALGAGAVGGKVLGAGGGGFILFFVSPEQQAAVRDALKELIQVPVNRKAPAAGSSISPERPVRPVTARHVAPPVLS